VRVGLKTINTIQFGKRTEAADMNSSAQFAGCTVRDHKTNKKRKDGLH
jgi:hypothetical protein